MVALRSTTGTPQGVHPPSRSGLEMHLTMLLTAHRVDLWSRVAMRMCSCTSQTLTDQVPVVGDAPSSRHYELFLPMGDQQGGIGIGLLSTSTNTKPHETIGWLGVIAFHPSDEARWAPHCSLKSLLD